jgi:hypothetical protein
MSRNETRNWVSMAIAEVSRITAAQDTQAPGDAPAKAASVALVPVVATPRRLARVAQGVMRPNACFVTHLIAMAELSPQTRLLRRAAPEDVQAAYRSVADQNRTVTPPGVRQIA